MKIALATHALRGYPPNFDGVSTVEQQRNLFAWMQRQGFNGIEVGAWWFNFFAKPISEVVRLREDLDRYGLELAGFNLLRKNVVHPAVAEEHKQHIRLSSEAAKVVRPRFVSISFSLDGSVVGVPADRVRGTTESPGASKFATDEDFVRTAGFLKEMAREAATAGVEIAIEMHHCSVADNSRSLLRLLELANEPNVSANPDLGNVYWGYSVPEEEWYKSIERLAGRVKFWHVKNIHRIYVPEIDRSFFTSASLDAGDIDYRWALGRLMAAGFDGYLSIEGAGPGDFLAFAARGKAYLDTLLAEVNAGIGLDVQ